MRASLLYRAASVMLVLFAAGHTMGFRRVDPSWGVEAAIAGLKQTRFDVQGFSRTYWGFYTGFGLFVTVLLLFSALLAWQLAGLPRDVLKAMPLATWGLALAFVAVTFLSWRYFFIAPVVFAAVITACLLTAAWSAAAA